MFLSWRKFDESYLRFLNFLQKLKTKKQVNTKLTFFISKFYYKNYDRCFLISA